MLRNSALHRIVKGTAPPQIFNSLFWFTEGVCEIWLTSEDTGAYGRDIGTSLPALLWKLVEVIPEGAMLRLGMTNPPYILEHLEVRNNAPMSQLIQHSPSSNLDIVPAS